MRRGRVSDFWLLVIPGVVLALVTLVPAGILAAHRLLVGPRKRITRGGGIAAVVRESHSDRQSTLLVRIDGPIADPAWSVHEVDLEELILAYMGEQHEPRLQSLPRLEANG